MVFFEKIFSHSSAQKEDVDVAVKAARAAFETGSEWRKVIFSKSSSFFEDGPSRSF